MEAIWLLILVIVWTLPWKGYALWLSARRGEKWWFIILLVVNTLALLEIIYIFFVAKRRPEIVSSPTPLLQPHKGNKNPKKNRRGG